MCGGWQVMEHEGIRAFYTSYRTTLVMNVPFTAVHFATYEAAKKALGQLGGGPGGEASEDHFATHLVAGGAAGALASAATNPLDVVKTRLQCQVTGVALHPGGSQGRVQQCSALPLYSCCAQTQLPCDTQYYIL